MSRLLGVLLLVAIAAIVMPATVARADASIGASAVARATFERRFARACAAFAPRDPCELTADLDGDGRAERIVKIRARAGAHAAGLAVFWRTGRITVLGAGTSERGRILDDDGASQPTSLVDDLSGVARWSIDPAARVPYPGRTRDAIRLDGGDATELYFHVDDTWVVVPLGF